MAKRPTIKKTFRLVAVLISIVTVIFFISIWVSYKEARKSSRVEKQAEESGLSYTTTNLPGESPEKRVQALARAISKEKQRTDRLAGRIGQLERDMREMKTLAGTMSRQVSQSSAQMETVARNMAQMQARLERLEKLLDKLVKGGALTPGGGGAGQGSAATGDGGTTTPTGAVVYGQPQATPAPATSAPGGTSAPQGTAQAPDHTLYIPSGSKMRVRLVNNVLAPAGGIAQVVGSDSPAYPAFARILSDIELEDGTTIPTSGGMALIMCVGDATNERAMPRVKQIRFFDGERYYEISSPEATVFDALDQAPGLLGVLDQSKRGREIAKAAALQATKVVADIATMQSGGLLTSTIPTVNPQTGQVGKPKLNLGAIGWSAAGSAVDRFIQFYLNQATQYFDTVHVSRTVILKRHGKKVQVPHEAYIIFTSPAFIRPVQKQGAAS